MFPTDPEQYRDRPPQDDAPDESITDAEADPAAALPPDNAPPSRLPEWASRFRELSVDLGADTVEFQHVREATNLQPIAVGAASILFAGFVAVVMPAMKLTALGNILWIVIGLAVIAIVAVVMQVQERRTRLRLNRMGLTVDEGTALEHESIVVLWDQLEGVELEAVNERDGRKGMKLVLRAKGSLPIDALPGVGIGELTNVRRVIIEALERSRLGGATA